jgi:hypothetical protein
MPYRLIPRQFRERVGRRGLVLILFGVAWITQGSAFFLLTDLFVGPEYFLVDRLPLPVQGGAWIACGVMSIRAGLRDRASDDTLGFLAVSAMPMLIAASALAGTVTYALQGSGLWVLGALTVLAWAPIIVALSVVASWYEPPIRSEQ